MNKTIKISIRIIAVFMVAIIMSVIPDLFPNLFGDWLCEGHYEQIKGCLYIGEYGNFHQPTWHWGYRHWLWFLMGIALFIIQVIDIIDKLEDK
jgi:hypothetical protein